MLPSPPPSSLFPYTTLFRSYPLKIRADDCLGKRMENLIRYINSFKRRGFIKTHIYSWGTSFSFRCDRKTNGTLCIDRKSTRLNSSHVAISYAVFCLKKKKI